ncbi:hypothetical protein K470DRAFT_217930 [Piedraia hortae CBS 480.64]|uniref:SPRY domain-containing protein n=1 Tax=Piedraia hortae CBS 480.64 TaxID=1314780 RepID=A0A6A7BZ44_9PEZI|nr:hypothetical protein K470DRAFT_217930 [Piedraia hortae CBS 480.64]
MARQSSAPRGRSKTPTPTPAPRERREKRETLKKRENASGSKATSTTLGKRKAQADEGPLVPQRFNVPPPRSADFDPPKNESMEPVSIQVPDGVQQICKPMDLAENKKGYRYLRAIADPRFPYKQYYRGTSPPPHYSRLSYEDSDRAVCFTRDALTTTNDKGWRSVRANVCVREGTMYYEVKVHRGIPITGPVDDISTRSQPHVRLGWARREAPLDAPVAFDGYSYGVKDVRFETIHRSRPGQIFHPTGKTKQAKNTPNAIVELSPEDQHIKEGDIIGLEIQLPSLTLHQKIVSGVYNPAVDISDGFDAPRYPLESGAEAMDVVRDRIPVQYKGNGYFEILDYVPSKPVEVYASRLTQASPTPNPAQGAASRELAKSLPNPNHETPALRTLPHSAIRVYKNGRLIGTAFENLLAFLPPASLPSKTVGAREGLDDGMVGYFPAISTFFGGIVEMNFGDGPDGFWCPPEHIVSAAQRLPPADKVEWNPGRQPRAVGERFKEQIAEDIVWDIVDEVTFFTEDGGYGGEVGSGALASNGQKKKKVKDED